MKKSFIIIFNKAFAPNESHITDLLDSIDPDGDWHRPFPSCVFFTSQLSAEELAKLFDAKFGSEPGKMFLITEIGSSKQGRLPERGWRVLNNPYNPRAK